MPKFIFNFITERGQMRQVRFNGRTADKALAHLLMARPEQSPMIGQLRSIAQVCNGRRRIVRRFA